MTLLIIAAKLKTLIFTRRALVVALLLLAIGLGLGLCIQHLSQEWGVRPNHVIGAAPAWIFILIYVYVIEPVPVTVLILGGMAVVIGLALLIRAVGKRTRKKMLIGSCALAAVFGLMFLKARYDIFPDTNGIDF